MAVMLIGGLSQSHSKYSSVQTAIRALELLLVSAGLISTLLMLKGAVAGAPSCSYDMVLSILRKPWFYFRSCLSSSFYICIVMNLIVIFIASSSLFHQQYQRMDNDNDHDDHILCFGENEDEDFQSASPSPPSSFPAPHVAPPPVQKNNQNSLNIAKRTAAEAVLVTETATTTERRTTLNNHYYHPICRDAEDQNCTVESGSSQAMISDVACFSGSKGIRKPHSLDSSAQEATTKKIMQATTAKESQEKSDEKQKQFEQMKECPELETNDAEEDDTMEATWRAITGGAKPQKQLKKNETWPREKRVLAADDDDIKSEELKQSTAASKELKKPMTFNDTVSIRCRGGLRRDPSMSLEEFNGQVEAFIKNFNNEMRLQRLESEQRYLDMISRGL